MHTRIAVFLALVCLAGCTNGTPFEPEMCEVTMNAQGEIVYPPGFSLERCGAATFRKTVRR